MRDEHAGLRGGRTGEGPWPQVRRRGAGHVLAQIPRRIFLPFALDVSSLVSVSTLPCPRKYLLLPRRRD